MDAASRQIIVDNGALVLERRPELATRFRLSSSGHLAGIRCQAKVKWGSRVGEQCSRTAILGGRECIKHSGRLPGQQVNATKYLEIARQTLEEAAPETVCRLIAHMRQGDDLNVSLRASIAVLDRIGIGAIQRLEVDATITERSPGELLGERLSALAERRAALSAIPALNPSPAESIIAAGADPESDTETPEQEAEDQG